MKVAGRIAAEEINMPGSASGEPLGPVAAALRELGGDDGVAVGVFDVDDAPGAHHTDLQAVYGARPLNGERPVDVHAPEGAIFEAEDAECRVERPNVAEDAVPGARVDLDGLLPGQSVEEPQADVDAVRSGDDHRGKGALLLGPAQGRHGHHAVHEGARHYRRDVPDLAVAYALAGGQEAAAEPLGVADDGVDAAFRDDAEHLLGQDGICRERLLDQQRVPVLKGGEHRLDVRVLVGGDDDRGDFGAPDQLPEVGGQVIGAGAGRERGGEVFLQITDAEPVHPGVLAGQPGADPPGRPAS